MFKIFTNVIEGTLQTAVNTVKLPFGVIVSPIDDGKTIKDSAKGVIKGLEKIGSDK